MKIDSNINETEKSLISLINNSELDSEELFYEIIKNQDVIFENIENIKNPVSWINLFSLNKIKPIWLNVFKYYEQYGFDEFLVSYLNIEENYLELSKNDIKDVDILKEIKYGFITDLISTNEISNISYSFLIHTIEGNNYDLKIEKIQEEKLKLLIEKGIISLNKENFELLRICTSDKQILLIKLNFDKYVEYRDEEEIDYELEVKEYESLLNSDLSDERKVELIYELDEDMINEKNNLGNLVGEILKDHKLNTLSYSYLIKLLTNINSVETKIKLCNLYIDLFSKEVNRIEEVLVSLNSPFTNIIETGSNKPPIEYNQDNLRFIENLKNAKYIISYSSKDYKITKIRRT